MDLERTAFWDDGSMRGIERPPTKESRANSQIVEQMV